jgi:hypothetical protein
MNADEPPKDHVEEPDPYGEAVEEDSGNKATWQRLLFMLIVWILFCLGVSVAIVVIVLQFFWVLVTGEPKKELSTIGRQLGEYGRDIALYMSFNTEERPFPFGRDWPQG